MRLSNYNNARAFEEISREIQIKHNIRTEINNNLDIIKGIMRTVFKNSKKLDFYLQGSIVNHTIILPLEGKKFDIDIVVEYEVARNYYYDPLIFLKTIESYFRKNNFSSEVHNSTLCINFTNYSIDIMVGVKYSNKSMLVPDIRGNEWILKTPKLLLDWYKNTENTTVKINNQTDPFRKSNFSKKVKYKDIELMDNVNVLCYKGGLSNEIKVIQLLKRARDVYFEKLECKIPQSIIIYIFVKKFYEEKDSVIDSFREVIISINEFVNNNETFDIFVVSRNNIIKEEITDKWRKDKSYYLNFKQFINHLNEKFKSISSEGDDYTMFDEIFATKISNNRFYKNI